MLRDYPDLGRIGQSSAEGDAAVLAVPQMHQTFYERKFSALKRELRWLMESVLAGEVTEAERAALLQERQSFLSDAERVEANQQKVGWCQAQIYRILHDVSQRLGPLTAVFEGLKAGEQPHPERSSVLSRLYIDGNGNIASPGPEWPLFSTYGAEDLLARASGNRVHIVGAEDATLNREIALLVNTEGIPHEDSRVAALHMRRNEAAARQLRREIGRYGALVFGAAHFTQCKPTITDFLGKEGLAWIEFVPHEVAQEWQATAYDG